MVSQLFDCGTILFPGEGGAYHLGSPVAMAARGDSESLMARDTLIDEPGFHRFRFRDLGRTPASGENYGFVIALRGSACVM